MNLLDTDELVDKITSAFTSPEKPDLFPDLFDDEEPTLSFWDSEENDDFWTDKETKVETSFAPQRAADIHGLTPTPKANQRALDIHGVSGMTRHQLVAKMLAKEGMEYEWGGTTKATGFDCSGIIYRIMQNNGFTSFPRTSGEIYEHSKKISVERAIKTPGAILWHEGHIAISLGNGKTIEAMGEDYGVVQGNARGRFTGGGLLPETPTQGRDHKKPQGIVKTRRKMKPEVQSVDPVRISNPSVTAGTLPMVVFDVVAEARDPMKKPGGFKSTGDLNAIERGLRRGFLRAGRPDLAKMVGTEAFDKWIGAESGWNPSVTSPANNQGLANDGLFQVWRGHSYNSNGEVANMTPAQQAYLVATHFDLSPERIRSFAEEIDNGTYKGWG